MNFFIKHIWKILFLLVGAMALWLGASFLTKAFSYYRLSHVTEGKPIRWGVVAASEEKNYIYADFQFKVDSKTHTQRYIYPKPVYPSKAAGESALEDKKAEVLTVWYGSPEGAALERVFPLNDLIRFAVVFSILIYFVLLKNYLQNFQSNLVH